MRQISAIQIGSQPVNVEDLPAGIYFLKLYAAQHSWIERIVVQ
ncbi:MAG: T9SS type A sorting domain-containing protein [Saprospiraceae bacterium]